MRKNLYKVICRVDNGVDIEYYRSFVLAENLKSNVLFNEFKDGEIPEIYNGLFKDIENSRYFKIRLLNLKTQARHKFAVLVKIILKR